MREGALVMRPFYQAVAPLQKPALSIEPVHASGNDRVGH